MNYTSNALYRRLYLLCRRIVVVFNAVTPSVKVYRREKSKTGVVDN